MELLRELVRSVVREELQKQRLDQNAPMVSSLVDVIREEVRQVICDADFWILDDNLFPLVMSRLVGVAEELSSCTWIQNCGLVNTCLATGTLGPGNPLRNGDPVNEDDGIAKSHDEAYERAKSHVDVFAADQASAALFLNDFRRTGNWHSALGAVGLGTKNIVEQYVLGRSLYGMPGDRRKRAHNGESDTADAKRYLPDSSTGDTESTQMSQQMPSDAPIRQGG
ncbi:hypothetical protein MTO96_035827, partial [Rhipicephalus appendiculatus]